MTKKNLINRKNLNAKQKIITVVDVKTTNIIINKMHAQQKEKRSKLL